MGRRSSMVVRQFPGRCNRWPRWRDRPDVPNVLGRRANQPSGKVVGHREIDDSQLDHCFAPSPAPLDAQRPIQRLLHCDGSDCGGPRVIASGQRHARPPCNHEGVLHRSLSWRFSAWSSACGKAGPLPSGRQRHGARHPHRLGSAPCRAGSTCAVRLGLGAGAALVVMWHRGEPQTAAGRAATLLRCRLPGRWACRCSSGRVYRQRHRGV